MKKFILAGGSGFLGRSLAEYLCKSGHAVTILTRSPKITAQAIPEVQWDARTISQWSAELEGATAVINLAGRSVDCRYTAANRKLIMDSRVDSTRIIGEAIAQCKSPPAVWLNASTATIYRHTFGPAWDEEGDIGAMPEAKDAFSVEVATAWERALNEAPTPQTRKVAMRTAMVMGCGKNSVFPVLSRLVRLGLGGKMGTGEQFVSWIHELDFHRAVSWLIEHDALNGPVNLSSPNPVINAEMMKILRGIFHMPFGLPATEWMLEIGAYFLRTETELSLRAAGSFRASCSSQDLRLSIRL